MSPKRIQLRRTKGWRLADHSTNALIVDRRGPYGNPFLIEYDRYYDRPWKVWWSDVGPLHSLHDTQRDARAAAVELFEAWAAVDVIEWDAWQSYATAGDHERLMAALAHGGLRGRDVACWCPLDHPCHGDVLLRLVSSDEYREVAS